LGLDVFENEKKKTLALSEISEIQKKWSEEKYKISLASEAGSIVVSGIRESADDCFDGNLVELSKLFDGREIRIYSYIGNLVERVETIEKKGMAIRGEFLMSCYLHTIRQRLS